MAPPETADQAPTSRVDWWITVGVCVAGIAAVSVLGALAVHQACYDTPPPVAVPMRGTPRAGYCTRVESFHLWPFLIGVPIALAAAALALSGRRVRIAFALAALIAAAVLVNAIVANQLEWSVTI